MKNHLYRYGYTYLWCFLVAYLIGFHATRQYYAISNPTECHPDVYEAERKECLFITMSSSQYEDMLNTFSKSDEGQKVASYFVAHSSETVFFNEYMSDTKFLWRNIFRYISWLLLPFVSLKAFPRFMNKENI